MQPEANFGSYYGYIDKNQNLVIPYKYDIANDFHEGLAVVGQHEKSRREDDLFGVINKSGKLIVPIAYRVILDYQDGLALYITDDESYEIGYFDTHGKRVIDFNFADVRSFKNGLAAVAVKKGKKLKWGVIDKNGKYVITPQFDEAFINLTPVRDKLHSKPLIRFLEVIFLIEGLSENPQ